MMVNGLRTRRETIEVEVDPTHVISRLWMDWHKSVDPRIEGDRNGMWLQSDGMDYHRREDRYKDLRPMTDEEKVIDEAFRVVYQQVKGTP